MPKDFDSISGMRIHRTIFSNENWVVLYFLCTNRVVLMSVRAIVMGERGCDRSLLHRVPID